jgi:hypothetical protein
MNLLLWMLQLLLSLFAFAGGAYKVYAFDAVAARLDAIPRAGWSALGVLEIVCAIVLVVPAALRWQPWWTPTAAAVLALEALALAGVYARASLALTASNPLVWSVAIALVAVIVAYGRSAVRPIG